MDTTQFNGSFWITIVGLILGFLSGTLLYCLKSKCRNTSICFGLVKIERDVECENDEEKMELEHNLSYAPKTN